MACFEAFDPAYDLPPEWSEPGDSGGGEAGADAPDAAAWPLSLGAAFDGAVSTASALCVVCGALAAEMALAAAGAGGKARLVASLALPRRSGFCGTPAAHSAAPAAAAAIFSLGAGAPLLAVVREPPFGAARRALAGFLAGRLAPGVARVVAVEAAPAAVVAGSTFMGGAGGEECERPLVFARGAGVGALTEHAVPLEAGHAVDALAAETADAAAEGLCVVLAHRRRAPEPPEARALAAALAAAVPELGGEALLAAADAAASRALADGAVYA